MIIFNVNDKYSYYINVSYQYKTLIQDEYSSFTLNTKQILQNYGKDAYNELVLFLLGDVVSHNTTSNCNAFSCICYLVTMQKNIEI